MVSLNIYKNSPNKFGRKTGFKIENEIEDVDQLIQKLTGILTQVFCTCGPNLVTLAWTGNGLSCRQAQNGVTFDFEVKFDLEGQDQSPLKTIGILTKVFYTYGPNLVILAWTGDELSRGQASAYRTHRRTSLSMNKPTTWWKSGRVSLVSSSCLYKTQPERALAQWTDGHTDRQTQATTIPEGQNRPRVKIKLRIKQTQNQ